ncbi:MAG: hypothetical protein IIZ67_04160 [Bacilli bacterium]|nr:hypothetical protein [Bacilli bacterium]
MNEKDIRNLNKYLSGEEVSDKIVENLKKKVELIVKQMDLRDSFNKDMEELSKEMSNIKD